MDKEATTKQSNAISVCGLKPSLNSFHVLIKFFNWVTRLIAAIFAKIAQYIISEGSVSHINGFWPSFITIWAGL